MSLTLQKERNTETFSTSQPSGKHRDSDQNKYNITVAQYCPTQEILLDDKKEEEKMLKMTSTRRDELQTSVSITVPRMGGIFKLPKLGVAMIFPPGAVTCETKLQISIDDMFRNPSSDEDNEKGVSWRCITPLVRIKPDDVCYQKPVYLIVNHNINLSPETFKEGSSPIMLHRQHDDDEWEIIPVPGEVHTDSLDHTFPVCQNKKALFTHKDVIVQMETNCVHCAYINVRTELGVTLRAYRMSVLVYADYHPAGPALNIRVFVVHGTQDRVEVVKEDQMSYGGHSLGSTVVDVAHSDSRTPISIDLRLSANGRRLDQQQGHIQHTRFIEELDHRSTGVPPKVNFPVSLPSGNPLDNVRIEVSATQCSQQHEPVDTFQDLVGLKRALPNEIANRRVPYQSPSEECRPSPTYQAVRQCLQELLTANEREIVKNSLNIVSPTDDFDAILDIFVNDGDPQTVLDKLQRIGVRNTQLEARLRSLI